MTAGFVAQQGDGFFQHVGGTAQIIGRFPRAKSIRLRGAWCMGVQPTSIGAAVVRHLGGAAQVVLADAYSELGETANARTWYLEAASDSRFRDYCNHRIAALAKKSR